MRNRLFLFWMLRVVLLLSFSSFFRLHRFPCSPRFRLRILDHSWYRATRGMTHWPLSESSLRVPVATVVRLSPAVFTTGSAVRIHRPRHLSRLGPCPAGRLSTSELVGAWGKAPLWHLRHFVLNAILSIDTFARDISVLFRHRVLPNFLNVGSRARCANCAHDLRNNALLPVAATATRRE